MVKIHFYTNVNGMPSATVDAPYEELGRFLEDDIQGKQEVSLILQIISDVKSGKVTHWEGTGNAHTVILTPGNARIENEFTDPMEFCELSLDDLTQALEGWIEFREQFSDK